ncbi:hydroxymethylglutaryl-coenzyme A synthase C terminal-domain-containing protein [Fomitopsis serialis]|uniref:hydroxymethylglutaryl-coenzyme A synthase C terminal-domain-containing protein n=1 Tax=Fomitopsis serialis TaxID=139415 RepID=UPI00200868BC|nr:hydroxymethylglutaryl-coenzyme A synthase C terminal-domain-containing protein [Neoantrodia serialis]KAH9922252.1 hydroxymethylglutaryl-coenzyme A synthase C terminal-domain-containing protein [Neoantrodia serialis]
MAIGISNRDSFDGGDLDILVMQVVLFGGPENEALGPSASAVLHWRMLLRLEGGGPVTLTMILQGRPSLDSVLFVRSNKFDTSRSCTGGLASLPTSVESAELKAKHISMFAFSSDLASSFFTIRMKGDTKTIREKLDLINRLESMKVVPCQTYIDALTLREKNHNAGSYIPEGSLDNLWPGDFYLEH